MVPQPHRKPDEELLARLEGRPRETKDETSAAAYYYVEGLRNSRKPASVRKFKLVRLHTASSKEVFPGIYPGGREPLQA